MRFTSALGASAFLFSLANAIPIESSTESTYYNTDADPSNDEDLIWSRAAGKLSGKKGDWQATTYESVMSPYTPGESVKIGANLRLQFTPKSTLKDTTQIRLIQYKLPITTPKWDIDSTNKLAWFGWGDDNKPRTITKIDDQMDVFKNEVGKPSTGEGKKRGAKSLTPAFLIDTVREPTNVPEAGKQKQISFTTYAYDMQNKAWLGGVSWGVVIETPAKPAGAKPVARIIGMKLASQEKPGANEKAASEFWMSPDVIKNKPGRVAPPAI